MKKVIFILISLFILVGGGLSFMYYHEKQQNKEQYFAEQEQRVESYLKYNIPYFKSVTFTDNGVSPMGLAYLEGYINNNLDLSFTANVEPNDHNFNSTMTMTDQLYGLFNSDTKGYNDIIKEKRNNLK